MGQESKKKINVFILKPFPLCFWTLGLFPFQSFMFYWLLIAKFKNKKINCSFCLWFRNTQNSIFWTLQICEGFNSLHLSVKRKKGNNWDFPKWVTFSQKKNTGKEVLNSDLNGQAKTFSFSWMQWILIIKIVLIKYFRAWDWSCSKLDGLSSSQVWAKICVDFLSESF